MDLSQRVQTLITKANADHTETLTLIQRYLDNLEKEKESLVEQLKLKLENKEPYRCTILDNRFRFSYTVDMSPETEIVISSHYSIKEDIENKITKSINDFVNSKYPLLFKEKSPFHIERNIGYVRFEVNIPQGASDNYYDHLAELNLPDILKRSICKEKLKKDNIERVYAKKQEDLKNDLELFSFRCKDVLPDIISRFLARNHKISFVREGLMKIAEIRPKDLEDFLLLDLSYESRDMGSDMRGKYLEVLTKDIIKVFENSNLTFPGYKITPCSELSGLNIYLSIK